ncbi:hypothetical protein KEHDKFFH_08380 [Marinobacter maroccanus]|uniref:Glycosyltransferase subfamily 4-like N-terminal domain-containing protein n=1 Tax=Marinobacter maroccanus TaxID=2055143 RepID=A0A2S5ZBE6_9GAMM|nr:glycosyltransferase family 4 protein [Marinobacter maroccanus]PPI84709.1 hypothetical protein KEHDKFFH_08380 [Marinobacter maroccanus]
MKVLTVANVNPDKFGSFEKYLVEFTDFLANKGHEHEILFSSEPIAEVSHALDRVGAIVKVMPAEDGQPRLSGWALFKLARSVNPDIVHLHFYPILCLFSFLMLFSRARLFATYHMSGAPADNGKATRVLKNIRWWLLGSAHRRIFCVSRYNREKFINDYRCPPAVAEVVYNAVNQTTFESIRAQRKNRRRGKTLPVKFISVAYPLPGKGIQNLIKACAVLQRRHLEFELLIVGDGRLPTSSELPGLSTRVEGSPRSLESSHEGIGNDDELATSIESMIESNEIRLRWDHIAKSSMEKSNLLTRLVEVVTVIGISGNVWAR